MTTAPALQIPRFDNESTPAYEARVRYVSMGPQRSLEKVGQQLGKSTALMERWSARHDWQDHARRYDETLASLQAQQAAQQYLADLKEHQERYRNVGKRLYAVAMGMLNDVNRQREDMKPNATTLATVSRALTTAADLEAHALGLDRLLAQLTPDERGV